MFCVNCGQEIKSKEKLCNNCKKYAINSPKFCNRCGNMVSSTQAYCVLCNTEVITFQSQTNNVVKDFDYEFRDSNTKMNIFFLLTPVIILALIILFIFRYCI